jgi:hypothetical protein
MMGLGGQDIHIVPSKNMVVVFTGGMDIPTHDREVIKLLDEFIVPAAVSSSALTENPAALAELQRQIAHAASPVRPTPPLPALSARISGQEYKLTSNSNGWTTIAFDFQPGLAEAAATIDGALRLRIGLDNVYRTTDLGDTGVTRLRGRWEGEDAFIIDASEPGEWRQWRYRVTFGDRLLIEVADEVSGARYTITGTRAR